MSGAAVSEGSATTLQHRAAAILRRAKIRQTDVREAVVVAVLKHGGSSFEARRLVERVVLDGEPVSVASCYRVLRELDRAGVLHHREQDRRVWYDLQV